MPGNRCAVYNCDKSHVRTKIAGEHIVYHNFPKERDSVSIALRQEWIRRCGRTDKFNPNSSRICSLHFTDTDYERDLQNELLGLRVRKILRKVAIPTINLPVIALTDTKIPEPTTKEEGCIKIRRPEEVNHLITDTNTKLSATELTNDTVSTNDLIVKSEIFLKSEYDEEDSNLSSNYPSNNTFYPVSNNTFYQNHCDISSEYVSLATYKALLDEYNNLQKEFIEYKEKCMTKEKSLNDQINDYKQEVEKKAESEELLKKILTENQIAILSKKKKRVNWTRQELAVAFTLNYYSNRCYLYLKDKLHYPLPGVSSLKKWGSQMNGFQGVLHDILAILNVAGEQLSDYEKVVVLQFGQLEVKSDETLEDSKKQLQVIMARGLFSSWEQPIYVAFGEKMTRDILMNAVSELHKISYNVVACVSDCGIGNVELWKELEIGIKNSYFKHPQTNKNIYMFVDAPHILLLLRNFFVKSGFQLHNNKKIDKTPLESLCNMPDPHYKITQKHLSNDKSQRRDVSMAVQLLSNTVGTALLRHKPGVDKELADNLGNFICDIDKWFDIFNSNVEEGIVPTKSAFGVHLKSQTEHLDKLIKVISTIRVCGKKKVQNFQKGMIMSMNSLKLLYHDMSSLFSKGYICTYKLNLNCLQKFFSQIRSKEPSEDPSSQHYLKQSSAVIPGNNSELLNSRLNSVVRSSDYIVANVMNEANITPSLPETNITGSSPLSLTALENEAPELKGDVLEHIAQCLSKHFSKTNFGEKCNTKFDHYNASLTEWLNKIKRWNLYFESYYDEFAGGDNVVEKVAGKIIEQENIPLDVSIEFCRLRINLHDNELRKCDKNTKRKSNSGSETSCKIRKLDD